MVRKTSLKSWHLNRSEWQGEVSQVNIRVNIWGENADTIVLRQECDWWAIWGNSEVDEENNMRSDWIGNQGLTSIELCKLGENFGFYFKCSEKPWEILKQVACYIFKRPLWLLWGEWFRNEAGRHVGRLLHYLGERRWWL